MAEPGLALALGLAVLSVEMISEVNDDWEAVEVVVKVLVKLEPTEAVLVTVELVLALDVEVTLVVDCELVLVDLLGV